jgi:hypothetical protein
VDSLKDCPHPLVPILLPKQEGQSDDLFSLGFHIDYSLTLGEGLPDNLQVLATNPHAYKCFEEMLDDIYTGFLTRRYRPYSYGERWVIAKPSTYVTLLALPWLWLREKRTKALIDVVPNYSELRTPFPEYGFGQCPGAVWAIVDEGFEEACGFFTSETEIAEMAFAAHMKSFSYLLAGHTRTYSSSGYKTWAHSVRQLHELEAERYRHKLVLSPRSGDWYPELANGAVVVVDKRQIDGD